MTYLDRLTDNQREVIILKFQQDLSYREIQTITGLTTGNIGFLIHTGLKRLREILPNDLRPKSVPMKLHPEDPRITAYVLGELAPEEAAAVERAAAEDPAIQEKIREAGEIQLFLKERLTTPTGQLLPRQRENIRRSASQSGSRTNADFVHGSIQPWLIPAAAAAVLALATFILTRMPADKPAQNTAKTLTSPTSAESTKTAESPAPKVTPPPVLPAMAARVSIPAADAPTLELPILPGKPNLTALTRPIRDEGHLPLHEAVRLDEILNSFPLRLDGTTAIARGGNAPWHPDNRDSGVSAHVATLSTEMIACPWKPSATLLLISVRANGQKDCDVKIAFHPESGKRLPLPPPRLPLEKRNSCRTSTHPTSRRVLLHPCHRNRAVQARRRLRLAPMVRR